MFKDKTLLITGGTGSFGNAVLKRFLNTDIGEIRIFSRDEKKQYDLRRYYHARKIKCYIGDIRDLSGVKDAMHGVDYVFHAAALKQLPSCEFFPMEAVRTNIIGTENVLNAAIECKVKKIICLSTDKAAYPISAMGSTKLLMEKIFTAKSRLVSPHETSICGTRFGNVMASRGSVIPLFVNLLKENKPLTITHPNMKRFIMDVDEAVDLVLFAFKHGETGDIMVQKAPACTTQTLAQALFELFEIDTGIEIIGIRHGEVMYETLLTKEEATIAVDMGDFYKIPLDKRNLDYEKYSEIIEDESIIHHISEFNSDNTVQLDVQAMKEKLLNLDYIQKELDLWSKTRK